MTLQGLTRLAVNAHDHTVGVTGKINSNFDLDLTQLLLDLLLLLGLAPLDVWTKLARDACYFVEEREFSLIEGTLLVRKA